MTGTGTLLGHTSRSEISDLDCPERGTLSRQLPISWLVVHWTQSEAAPRRGTAVILVASACAGCSLVAPVGKGGHHANGRPPEQQLPLRHHPRSPSAIKAAPPLASLGRSSIAQTATAMDRLRSLCWQCSQGSRRSRALTRSRCSRPASPPRGHLQQKQGRESTQPSPGSRIRSPRRWRWRGVFWTWSA